MGFHLHLLPLAIIVVACTLTLTLVFIICMIRFRSRRSTHGNNNPILFYVNGNSPVPASDDDDVGPSVVDHPIWFIRTVGLQQPIIDSITAFTYRKNEGLIDGTECSVCLGEFQEEESIRLLPKCSHAFHVPCIDTWLASHTNCPLCRAPVVHGSGGSEVSAAEPDRHSSVSGESEASIVISSRDEGEGEETEHVRRSVSVDSSSSVSMVVREDVVVDLNYEGERSESQVEDSGSKDVKFVKQGSSGGSSVRGELQKRQVSLRSSFSSSSTVGARV